MNITAEAGSPTQSGARQLGVVLPSVLLGDRTKDLSTVTFWPKYTGETWQALLTDKGKAHL